MSTDLKIRVVSNLKSTQQFMLYQEAISLNVKNFKTGAWEHQFIAPKATFSATLPTEIKVGATSTLGKGQMETQLIECDYGTGFDIFYNNKGLDIKPSNEPAPTEDTIDVFNNCTETKYAVVTKDGKPLFGCEVRPEYKVNFAIHPMLYVALSDCEIVEDFFDAATLSKKPYEISYEGEECVTVYLTESAGTGTVTITHDFKTF